MVNVFESTIKIGSMDGKEFFLGFTEFKVEKVENKSFDIPRTSIYKFRFQNSAISGRVCKILIQRIPASAATQSFNTNVYWRTVSDTTYTATSERHLVRSDTTIVNVLDQTVARVASQSALTGASNTTIVDFDLPVGTAFWSYYIGVGKEGKQAFDAARDKFLTTTAKQVSKIEGYGTMAALAIYGLNLFANVQGRNNVKYWFIPDWNDVMLFQSRQAFYAAKQGDVVNDAARMTTPLNGKVYLGLYNDNLVEAIDVIIRVTAVKIDQTWETRAGRRMSITQ